MSNSINSKYYQDIEVSETGENIRKFLGEEPPWKYITVIYDEWLDKIRNTNMFNKKIHLINGNTLHFENFMVNHPYYTEKNNPFTLTPSYARKQEITYGADWHFDIVERNNEGDEVNRKEDVCLFNIPLMLKSRNCVLYGKNYDELRSLGEDPVDPGGYFIIDGKEKCIILQEKIIKERFMLTNIKTKTKHDKLTVRMISFNVNFSSVMMLVYMGGVDFDVLKMSFPVMREAKEKLYEKKDNKSINIIRIFSILGYHDINEIKSIINLFIPKKEQNKCMIYLNSTIIDASIYNSRKDNINYFVSKFIDIRLVDSPNCANKLGSYLDTYFFPNTEKIQAVNGESLEEKEERKKKSKIYLLGIMISKILRYQSGYINLDDKDSWINKQIESPAATLSSLFRYLFGKFVNESEENFNQKYLKTFDSIIKQLKNNKITSEINESFRYKWGSKAGKTKEGIIQILYRENSVSTQSHINTIDINISSTDKQIKYRTIKGSQLFIVCPFYSPENEKAGILKTLAILCRLTYEVTDNLFSFFYGDEEKGIKRKISFISNKFSGKLMYEDIFLGWCDIEPIRKELLMMRRSGRISPDISIIVNDDWLYIETISSRLVHPTFVVDDDQQLVVDNKNIRHLSISKQIKNGAIEYLSPWEQEQPTIKIALRYSEITSRNLEIERKKSLITKAKMNYDNIVSVLGKEEVLKELKIIENDLEEFLKISIPYTHCEMSPLSYFGSAASLIPYTNYNQAPRNTYQVSMGKQAQSNYHSNHKNRFESGKVLVHPQRPMAETETSKFFGLSERGPGQNIIIAFMAFPNTEEDSFILKKEFVDSGGMRMVRYLEYNTEVCIQSSFTDILGIPGKDVDGAKHISIYKNLNTEENNPSCAGLPIVSSFISNRECIIGKIKNDNTLDKRIDDSIYLKVGEEGIVDKVYISTDNNIVKVHVKLRLTRNPQQGDKVTPRNAQKGTISMLLSDVFIPCNNNGVSPDLIVTTFSIPTRMTVSFILELISSKYGALAGKRINATAFVKSDLNAFFNTLKKYKKESNPLNKYGYEVLRSRISGKTIETPIYFGPVYYQILKHLVLDKYQSRGGTGQYNQLFHQPVKGRGIQGGLRFGEMERDALISHGASEFLLERLMKVSDAYIVVFCKDCGEFAVNDYHGDGYLPCKLCQGSTFGKTTIPYSYKVLIHFLNAMGMNLHPELKENSEILQDIINKSEAISNEEDIDSENEDFQIEDDEDEDIEAVEEDYMGID